MEIKQFSDSSKSVNPKKSKTKRPRKDTSDDDIGELIVDVDSTTPSKQKTPNKTTPSNSANKKRKKRDSASSDEERWLTAIESGKLEDVDDELKKIKPKDPSLMTARQRAMYDRGGDGGPTSSTQHISLPTGYKEKVMTPEAIQKAAIKSLKRKQLADEKREKDKKKTMDRLLKKQESKALKCVRRHAKLTVPAILYRQTVDKTIMAFPPNLEFPIKTGLDLKVPQVKYCSMNCGNPKRYSCSKTGAPLCSLDCYKKNISSRIL